MTDDAEDGFAPAFFPGEIIGDCVLQKAHRIRDERQEVWFAFDRKRNAPAVLKFIRDDHRNAAMAPALAEFLEHSQCRSLIRVLETGNTGRFFAVEQEYASGGSLSARLKCVRNIQNPIWPDLNNIISHSAILPSFFQEVKD